VSRPPVSVVVPFAGDAQAARKALQMLLALDTRPGDELILSDNSGTAPASAGTVRVVRATAERSPAHARNAGAAQSHADWILFLDADTRPPADLLDSYFAADPAPGAGILAGEIRPAPGAATLAARYGAARNFLGQQAHVRNAFRPRAAAANLLVRRAAFEAADGFREGLRAAEDTDFCWRVQELGWTLTLREQAAVEHFYRDSIGELRRQWRAYAAGRAWLAREYPEFHPEPAARRALRRAAARIPLPLTGRQDRSPSRATAREDPGPRARVPNTPPAHPDRPCEGRAAPSRPLERAQFLALDVLLAFDELVGFRLSNIPG
jgi:GT2 family glycosyltransferase